MYISFSTFSGVLPSSRSYIVHISFLKFFNISHHISLPKECYSHFPWFSVFSPYSRSYSVHFSFFTFFSDFVIFQVVKWMFLIFHDFQFSCHIPFPTVDISHFPAISVFLDIFHVLQCVFLIFHIFSYLAIFQVLLCVFIISHVSIFRVIFHCLKCVILIFRVFQFFRHIPGPTVCIYYFSCFSIFLVIFHYKNSVILIFRDFQFSCDITGPTVSISHFSRFYWFRYFSSPQVCVSQFPWFSVFLQNSKSYSGHFSCGSFFRFPCHISRSKGCICYILHFQVSCHLRGPTVCIYHFSYVWIFLVIFN